MSANRVCDMSCGAMHEFALVLDKAGFNADIVQQVVNSRGNKLALAMYAALAGEAKVDDRFELVNTFDVVVPKDYDHTKRLQTFSKEHHTEFFSYNNITDENYAKATTKLEPGRRFKVKVFQIKVGVSSEDCLAKLRSEKAVLVGAQGASLAYEQGKKQLSVNHWSASFDEKEALWQDADGYRRVPIVRRRSGGGFYWDLGRFGPDWSDNGCLLCFCDAE